MAKELYSGPITFDASAGTVAIEGNYSHDKLLLITNITDGVQIYNFASPTKGASGISYDQETELTTITLNFDTSSMSDDDNLQVFLENYNQNVHFSDDMIDGVGKLRVSNPENLIDTDFEYGLQPTKWETLETSNAVPSFYVGEGDLPLTIISSITAISGSSIVTVNCSEDHGLALGTPIEVQGLTSRTAEGKFLISSVTASAFTYTATAAQNITGEIGSIYSTVTPGTFYTGSEIAFDTATGIQSDGADASQITVSTIDPHGFKEGSNFYLVNTVGAKTFKIAETATSNAPDGRPYVDHENTLTRSLTNTASLNETKQVRSRHHTKFTSSDVNTSTNTITWTSHQLKDNDCVMYMKPSGDTGIGGINSFDVYWVSRVDDNRISLRATRGGSIISLSSAGTSNFGRHSLHLVYEISRLYIGRRNRLAYWYTYAARYGGGSTGSGWDLYSIYNGIRGLGSGTVKNNLLISKSNWSAFYYGTNGDAVRYFSPRRSSNMTLVDNNTTPKNFNFMEDYERFNVTFPNNWNGSSAHRAGYFYTSTLYRSRALDYNTDNTNTFIMPVVLEEEADTLYFPNHGMSSGDTITHSISSGSDITVSRSTTSFTNNISPINYIAQASSSTITKIDDNRIQLSGERLNSVTGSYTFSATPRNPTANSFYVPLHGFNDNTQVTFKLGTGGAVPSSASGAITPDHSTNNTQTLSTAYGVLETAFNNYMSVNGITRQDAVTASDETATRVFGTGVSSGTSPMLYYDLRYTNHYYGGSWGNITPPTSNFQVRNFNKTTPYNLLNSTAYATSGRSLSMLATPFQANTTIPHYMWLLGFNGASETEYWFDYFRDGQLFSQSGNRAYTNNINRSRTVTASGNNYRFAWFAHARTRSNSPTSCYLRLKFKNYTDWDSYTTNTYTSFSGNTSGNGLWYGQGTTSSSYRQRQSLVMGITFMLDSTETWGVSNDFQSLVEYLIDQFDAGFAFQPIADNTVYGINIVDNNRFSVKTTAGAPIDITSSGTTPMTFKTEGNLGIIDGTYTASSVTDNNILINQSSKVEGQQVFLDSNVLNSYYLKVANSGHHAFLDGTAVVYDNGGNTDLGGLTNGDTYYVKAVDNQYISLHATQSDAVQNTDPIAITTGTGTHSVSTNSLAGLVEAEGSVDVTSGDTKIKGNATLFKRYFKAGDTIFIKDDNATPGEIVKFTVTAISDDITLTVDSPPQFSTTDTDYFVSSKIYTRPDGYAVHRPFDGGVEMAAGTAPYSHITRQTRKYFRYQSGKGIQTSVAINFNPPVTLENLTAITGLTPDDESFTVVNTGTATWDITEAGIAQNPILNLYRGATYTFNVSATGHPFYFTTDDGTDYVSGSYVDEYTTGVTGSRTDSGTVTFAVDASAPDLLYYACGNHESMIGTINILDFPSEQGNAVTKYPHRLTVGQNIRVKGASDSVYNGDREVVDVIDDFTFRTDLEGATSTTNPTGIIKYNVAGYSGAATRTGMFDSQNGFFFEYDGTTINCVRRSSTTQLSGSVSVTNGRGLITGTNTQFIGQLAVDDKIVLRGQTYKVVKINSNTELYVQPAFRGISASGVIITKVEDLRVAQADWNLDKCDGTGPTGFVLDKDKIQMAYMDYSWYGAGKIRFGFKERTGQIRYVHQFIHNNRLDESYMRSGNLPAKYEVENGASPTYAPTLFHWGTSVIMDGTFDDDKAYLFTAPSNTLSFTNGESSAVNTTGSSSLQGYYNYSNRQYDWYVRIPFSSNDASKFYSGLKLYTVDGSLDGEEVSYTGYSGSTFYVYIFVQSSRRSPATYPSASNAEAVSLGVPSSGATGDDVNLGTDIIPLVSLRLAPSVDANLTGNLGERDIINRMQLKMKEVGLILTHDCEVKLILNGDLSNVNWANVANPSLSQLIKHEANDIVSGGTEVFSFRAAGGSTDNTGARLSNTSNFDLGDIIDLGNSILGGDGTFPNGPDIVTVAVQVVDTGGIGSDNPFKTSARITWSESQA